MRKLASRKSSRALATAFVAIGLVATISVDVGLASAGGSNHSTTHQAAEKHAPAAYLAELRTLNHQMLDAVGPWEVAINFQYADSSVPWNPEAIRDSIAHSDGYDEVAAVRSRLAKLTAPSGFGYLQSRLTRAIDRMQVAVNKIRQLKDSQFKRVYTQVSGAATGRLSQADVSWDTAMENIFTAAGVEGPQGVQRTSYPGLPASRATWILHADQACLDVNFGLNKKLKVINAEKVDDASTEAFDDAWITATTDLDHAFKTIKRPAGIGALPIALRLRFQSLSYTADFFNRLNSDLKSSNFSGYLAEYIRIQTVEASEHGLALQLDSYGAQDCGYLVDGWAGHGVSAKHASHGGPSST